jgi:ABC-type multidrug transport system ATPase subunit
MSEVLLSLRGASSGELRRADLALGAGRFVVLSTEVPALGSLANVVIGQRAPRSGQVTFRGREPARSPALRARMATLLDVEELAPARTVVESVGAMLAARGEAPTQARHLLAEYELDALALAAPELLSQRERRSIALALALSHPNAELCVLFEPLSTQLARASVLSLLDQRVSKGALVINLTSSSADAAQLGGGLLLLELGRVAMLGPGNSPPLGGLQQSELIVEASDLRELARALHESPLALGLELTQGARSLRVRGAALDAAAREVMAAARSGSIEITRLEPCMPAVEALLAARAGSARGAYEAARAHAFEQTRGAPAGYA